MLYGTDHLFWDITNTQTNDQTRDRQTDRTEGLSVVPGLFSSNMRWRISPHKKLLNTPNILFEGKYSEVAFSGWYPKVTFILLILRS